VLQRRTYARSGRTMSGMQVEFDVAEKIRVCGAMRPSRIRMWVALCTLCGVTACGSTVGMTASGEAAQGATTAHSTADLGVDGPAGQAARPSGSAVLSRPGAGSSRAPASASNSTTKASPGTGPVARTINRGPITIGFVYADFTKLARQLGQSGETSSNPFTTFPGLVRAINARGGLAGRTIRPVYYRVDGAAASFDTEAEAACAALTQDRHVDVVVSANYTWPASATA
jgi:hypothetical protein